jgi:hypothetical protein
LAGKLKVTWSRSGPGLIHGTYRNHFCYKLWFLHSLCFVIIIFVWVIHIWTWHWPLTFARVTALYRHLFTFSWHMTLM